MPFWRKKRLQDMTPAEWESLCDGCGRCCLEKLEDMHSGEISYTNVACSLLDLETCRCAHYAERQRYMPDCVALTSANVGELHWMPYSCAYRRLAEGRDLADWHPLVSGDPDSIFKAGIAVRGRCISASEAGDLEDHIVDLPD
ncbi:MAG TPA: YcgN family cysteine cluster protein [Magnetovibrio sp.]